MASPFQSLEDTKVVEHDANTIVTDQDFPGSLHDQPRDVKMIPITMKDLRQEDAAQTPNTPGPTPPDEKLQEVTDVEMQGEEEDAQEGATRKSTSPDPSVQDGKLHEAVDTGMKEATEAAVQEGMSPIQTEKSRDIVDIDAREVPADVQEVPADVQEVPADVQEDTTQQHTPSGPFLQEFPRPATQTVQPPPLDLGDSMLYGPRKVHTQEQLEVLRSEQLKQALQLKNIMKPRKPAPNPNTAEIPPTEASQLGQREAASEKSEILPFEFRRAQAEWHRKKKNGTLSSAEEVAFIKLESRYNEQQNADADTGEKTRKRKAAPPKGPNRSKRQKNNLASVSNFGPSNFFEDADAAEKMADQPRFARGNVRKAALAALKAKALPESKKTFDKDAARLNRAMQYFRGRANVKPHDDGRWLVKGMKTSLLPSQIISTGFMCRRETEGSPKGGIIADVMGLGKTVQALALIVNMRPKFRDPAGPRSTLIVVPSSLISQWEREVKKHCVVDKDRKKWGYNRVRVFRESLSKAFALEDFEAADIVLTSYHDVMASWPDCKYPEGLSEEEKNDYYFRIFFEKRGLLHRQHWNRTILDEAHQIRNVESRTAKGCHNLVTDNAWCLTGTPMTNGATDLYSLFAFIKHPQVQNLRLSGFKRRFCNGNDPMSYDALSEELLSCMSRFSHKDKLFDARLISLPMKHKREHTLKFTPLEAAIYKVVHDRFKQRARTAVAADGSVQTKLMGVLALITLLRQLTAHPLMLPSSVCDWLEDEDFEAIEAVIEKSDFSKKYGESTIRTLRGVVHYRQKSRRASSSDSVGVEEATKSKSKSSKSKTLGTGKIHGKQNNADYQKYFEALKKKANFKCGKCDRIPDQPMRTDCNHYYCKAHYTDIMHEAARSLQPKATCVAKGCGRVIQHAVEESETTGMPKRLASESHMLPSTKTLAVKAQILEWLDPNRGGDPDAKIIIFTQWLAFLSVLCKVCEDEGWGYTTLHGKLKQSVRTENIDDFNTNPHTKIFICTLHTGGIGLNLTKARAVLNVDPWWNSALEDQAFGRVYRFGQQNETAFTNITIKKSIDEKLVKIKKEKNLEIDQVIKDHKSRGLQLTMELFDTDDEDDDSSDSESEDYDDDRVHDFEDEE